MDDGFYHGCEDENSPTSAAPVQPDKNAEALERMDQMLAAYRLEHGMKGTAGSSAGRRKRFSGYDPGGGIQMPEAAQRYLSEHKEQTVDVSRQYAYQRDARAQMDDMINEYLQQKKSKEWGYRKERTENAGLLWGTPGNYTGHANDINRIREEHPDARIAAAGDALGRFLVLLLLGLCLTGVTLSGCVCQMARALGSERAIAAALPVPGTTNTVSKSSGFARPDEYLVAYRYDYEGQIFHASDMLSESAAKRLGVLPEGKKSVSVTVYVSLDDPGRSRLAPEPYPPWWCWIAPLLGLALACFGLKLFLDCSKGKRAVYRSKGIRVFRRFR